MKPLASDALPLPEQAAPDTAPLQATLTRPAHVGDLRPALQPDATPDRAGDVFSTLAWFDNLRRHGVDAAVPLLALQCSRGPQATAALLLQRLPSSPSALDGPVLAALSNYYASLWGPAGDAAVFDVEGCRAALRALRAERGLPGVLELQPLDADSRFYADVQTALRAEGWLVDSFFCFGNHYLPVAGRSFEPYYEAHVPSRIRNTIRRGHKKLDDAGDWSLRIFDGSEADLETGIADFVAVYTRSWKVPEPYPNFVPNLIRTAAREGWLRLGVVRLGEIPLAAQLWLHRDGRALIYKLAYDEEHKRFSAGSVLTAELFRHAIDVDRVDEIDYLTGDDAYKRDWMTHRRERRGIVAFDPRTAQGLASAARHFAARGWRRLRGRLAAPSAPPAAASAP